MNGPAAQDLKARVDLRDVVRACWGDPHRHRARYDVYASRWRDDGKNPSFTVYDTHFKDYGGDGTSGDVFAFLMLELRCDFKTALAWLADYLGEHPPEIQPRRQPVLTPAANPPPRAWQQAAMAALKRSQRYLWSGREDAKRVLDYLRQQRGLTDASIKAAGYGYNPRWTETRWRDPETGKNTYLAPGIIEPWWADGNLWALRVRCRVGGLAHALGITDDHLGDAISPKYLNLSGSKQSGALYNGDHIQPGGDVLVVEGGFDAVLAAQHVDMPVVTFGSATNRPTGQRLEQLKSADRLFLLLDADAAGQQAADYLQKTLQAQVIPVHLPDLPGVKDVTDYVVGHGGDLTALIDAAQKRVWWADGLPDAVRSAVLTYFRASTAPVLELINRALNAGLLDADDVTINAIIAADKQLGNQEVGVSAHSIRRVMSELTGYAWHVIDTDADQQQGRGRAAIHYRLATVTELHEMMLLWAAPRIYEKHHPTDSENGVVARPTPAMLHALGFDAATAQAISETLDTALETSYNEQHHMQDASKSTAYRQLAGLRRDLENPHSTPLPIDWPLNTPASYRAALLRATNDPDERRSRRSIRELVGISNGSVNAIVQHAGLEKAVPEGEYAYSPLTSPYDISMQVRNGARQVKGYPLTVISERENGEVVETAYAGHESVPFIAAELGAGAAVQVRYQVANRYVVCSDAPVIVKTEPKTTTATPGSSSTQKTVYGPRYNPAWVRDQLKLALLVAGRVDYRPYPQLTDTHTGEVLCADDDGMVCAHALLRLLLPDVDLPQPIPPDDDDLHDSADLLRRQIGTLLNHL